MLIDLCAMETPCGRCQRCHVYLMEMSSVWCSKWWLEDNSIKLDWLVNLIWRVCGPFAIYDEQGTWACKLKVKACYKMATRMGFKTLFHKGMDTEEIIPQRNGNRHDPPKPDSLCKIVWEILWSIKRIEEHGVWRPCKKGFEEDVLQVCYVGKEGLGCIERLGLVQEIWRGSGWPVGPGAWFKESRLFIAEDWILYARLHVVV